MHYFCNKHSSNLKFYYSDDDTISPVSKLNVNSTIIQTNIGIITNKSITKQKYKTIGNFSQYKICNPITNNSAFVNNLETFYLQDGNIQFQPIGIQLKNVQGNYGLPPNITKIFKIINGTGKYLNLEGYVKLYTYPNLERLVKIYFRC
jgi:hypothetical protein